MITHPIPLEYPLGGYSSGARASAGQSYVSSGGSSWTDIATQYGNTNVCVKAFGAAPQTPVADFNATPGMVLLLDGAVWGFVYGESDDHGSGILGMGVRIRRKRILFMCIRILGLYTCNVDSDEWVWIGEYPESELHQCDGTAQRFLMVGVTGNCTR